MTEEPPKDRIPRLLASRQLMFFTAVILALWVFVTFFFRNPYQQAVEFGYYDSHPYDEGTIWTYVLFVIPMIGLGAALLWWQRRSAGK
ncbi:MAG TPA: hypothetical protein VIF40_03215 [Methylosinus sp.]|jgi:hypothetical protein|uniref:hypothetical protein n=1 Tax=Methylosinus sp. TaxID=427 RepID=UPI002F945DF1